MTKRPWLVFVGILCFLVVLTPETGSAQEVIRESLPVRIVTVRSTADERKLSLTGEIEARELLSASFHASGRIVELAVEQGDRVTKGMVLARLDSELQEQALRSAEAALKSALANAEKTKSAADRQDALLARGATTRMARDTAADELRAANAAVAEAKANLDRARQALDDTILRAPEDATITEKSTGVGQVIANAQTVLKLAIGNRYDAVFQLPENLLAIPPESRPEKVSIAALGAPHDAVDGKVRLISPVVDSTHGTVKVSVGIPTLPKGLQIGDSVVGTVHWTEKPQIVLPWSALTAADGKPAVWVVNPMTKAVTLRKIGVLRYENDNIVVARGLGDGELVVGSGANLLFPGRTVRVADGA